MAAGVMSVWVAAKRSVKICRNYFRNGLFGYVPWCFELIYLWILWMF
ncbi:MAG: hypothetical protein PHY15_06805 [Eubacteriales bacterium]|nr:hypothetical protein [Eubacteriales bacterium]